MTDVDHATTWRQLHAARVGLADIVDGLDESQASTPSRCDGWRVRDVVGHLVHLAEASQLSMARDVVRHGPLPDRALARVARRLGDRPLPELATRLRAAADGHFRVPGMPPVTALAEVLVHREDALAPLGIAVAVEPDSVVPALELYRRIGRLAFGSRPEGVTLVATDADWTAGEGPRVEGRALDLLVLLAGRHQVVDALHGPGVERLR